MMQSFKTLSIIFLSLLTLTSFSQLLPPQADGKSCGIEHSNEMTFKNFPELKEKSNERLQEFNAFTQNQVLAKSAQVGNAIPVVFHLISACDNPFDFSLSELNDVLIEVNKDFNATNTHEYSQVIDPTFFSDHAAIGLVFRLAEIDPLGNPTDGVTRSHSYYSNQGSTYQVPLKEIIQWDPTQYLNVWIVENVSTSGYAQYPWTAEVYPELDGIVYSYDYVGENNIQQRPNILSHEIGHWLGLLHTWGDFTVEGSCPDPLAPTYCDCDDLIEDTPNNLGYISISCPSILENTCIDPVNDRPDNTFNFMDYACEVMFTHDQKTRMLDIIANDVAGRDNAVTVWNDDDVFMTGHPDWNKPKLMTDKMVYTESFEVAGSILESGFIELRDCASCTFSADVASHVSSTLPPHLEPGLIVEYEDPTTVKISFDVAITDYALEDATADVIFDLIFDVNAFTGVTTVSDVFNNAMVKGIKVDFIHNYPSIESSVFPSTIDYVVTNSEDGNYGGAGIPFVFEHASFYHYQNGFFMYSGSSFLIEVAVDQPGSLNVALLGAGEQQELLDYQPLTTGFWGGASELVLYNPGTYTAWLGQTGYVAIRITFPCGEHYYAWAEVSVTANDVTFLSSGINAYPNGIIETGQTELCIDNRTISDSHNLPSSLYIDATDWIESTSTIALGADITYDAGDYVELKSGFDVQDGAEFLAKLEGCECIPKIISLADLSLTDYCSYAYLLCNYHPNDNKEFELVEISTGTTSISFSTEHYTFVTLTPDTEYKFRVRKQCGDSGIYGGWSEYVSFKSCIE